MGAEYSESTWGDSVVMDPAKIIYAQMGNQFTEYRGGSVQAGMALSSRVGVGAGVSAAILRREYFTPATGLPYPEHELTSIGGFLGVVVRDGSGALAWDALAGWSTEPQYWFDQGTMDFVRNSAPIYVEQTLTASFLGGRAFVALKQVNDFFPDRATWYGRFMPVAEVWLFNLVALRAGAEGSVVLRDGTSRLGWGATGGLSLKIWKFSLDANYTLRQRPSRSLQEVVVPESIFFFTLSMDGLLKN